MKDSSSSYQAAEPRGEPDWRWKDLSQQAVDLLPPVCAFSVFLSRFDTMLYEILFSPDLGLVLFHCFGVVVFVFVFPSPTLFFLI